jgi:hypothetical protein
MDRREAVKLTKALWVFLAEDENNTKDMHPEFKEVYEDMQDHCPLCQFEDNCKDCILIAEGDVNCWRDSSPFQLWNTENQTPHNTEGADRIVELCDRALVRMG